jgi:hypothetical protein
MGCCGIGGWLGSRLDESRKFLEEVVVDVVTLRPIFNLLGYNAEDILSTAVSDMRLLNDNTSDANVLLTKVAIEHLKTDLPVISLLSASTSTIVEQCNNYISYGKNTFIDGTLQCSIYSNTAFYVEYAGVIDTTYGVASTVINVTHGDSTASDRLWYYLISTYTYNPITSILAYTGLQYKLLNVVYDSYSVPISIDIARITVTTTVTTIIVTNIDATHDNVHTTVVVTITAFEGVISTTTTNTDTVVAIGTVVDSTTTVNTDTQEPTVNVAITVPTIVTTIYKVVFYTVNPALSYVWYYISGNVSIDDRGTVVSHINMMPVVTLRSNKVNINSDKNSTRYIQSSKMLSYLGLDVESLIANITDNPSINEVTDSFVHFAVDCKDNSSVIGQYLYSLFSSIYSAKEVSIDKCTMVFEEGTYNYVLTWDGIYESSANGTIVAIGGYTNKVGTVYGLIDGVTDEYGNPVITYGDIPALLISKQITATQYTTYAIAGLNGLTVIKSGGMVKGNASGLSSTEFLIPVGIQFILSLSPLEKLVFLRKALRLKMNSAVITHLAWYKTEKFAKLVQIVVIIIAVVLTIVTLEEGGSGGEAWLSLAASWGLGIASSYVIKELLASTNNPYLKALYVAVVIAIAVETSDTTGLSEVGICALAANTVTTAVTQYTEYKANELSNERTTFEKLASDKQAEIDGANSRFNSQLATSDVQALSQMQTSKGYIEGYDIAIYKAGVDYMCNWDLTKTMFMATSIYDYDKNFRLGIVSLQS